MLTFVFGIQWRLKMNTQNAPLSTASWASNPYNIALSWSVFAFCRAQAIWFDFFLRSFRFDLIWLSVSVEHQIRFNFQQQLHCLHLLRSKNWFMSYAVTSIDEYSIQLLMFYWHPFIITLPKSLKSEILALFFGHLSFFPSFSILSQSFAVLFFSDTSSYFRFYFSG